jgi:hypothetical protein
VLAWPVVRFHKSRILLMRTRNASEIGLTLEDVDGVLDALCAAAEQVQLEPAWNPRLSGPDDEPLLQMAVEARAPIIAG